MVYWCSFMPGLVFVFGAELELLVLIGRELVSLELCIFGNTA